MATHALAEQPGTGEGSVCDMEADKLSHDITLYKFVREEEPYRALIFEGPQGSGGSAYVMFLEGGKPNTLFNAGLGKGGKKIMDRELMNLLYTLWRLTT